MKTSFASIAATALLAAATMAAPAEAATFAFDFGLNGKSRVNGTFSYADTATGVIGFDGLEAFSLTTVGGPITLADGTTQSFASNTYSLDDVLKLSNQYFGFDTVAKSFTVQGFEGFAYPVVFAAFDAAGTTGFLVDFFNDGSSNGTVTDYAAGYVDGYDSVSMTAVVPEPASWALMLVGFAMVGAASRYRRRATAVAFS